MLDGVGELPDTQTALQTDVKETYCSDFTQPKYLVPGPRQTECMTGRSFCSVSSTGGLGVLLSCGTYDRRALFAWNF